MSDADNVALPTWAPERYTVTVSPATGAVGPLPLRETRTLGVSSLVLASLLLVPLSEAAFKVSVGAEGAVESLLLLVTAWLVKLAARLPAMSAVLPLPLV